ncbi:hypothetical protein A2U01_0074302, partial [Trifolium medium]|nr:hypothetical protein [Trifolium medium]
VSLSRNPGTFDPNVSPESSLGLPNKMKE